jgi:protein-S-isoprenylcysteine O-methyltransferase Ste14
MDSQSSPQGNPPDSKAVILKGIVRFLVLFLLMAVVLFLSAGTLRWWEAWAYIAQGLIVVLHSRITIIRNRPEMAVERAEASGRENVQDWDRWLMPFTALIGPLLSWLIAGLDFRFGWPPDLPLAVRLTALAVLFLGGLLGNWAMLANPFFSSQVRLQTDRGHQVVSSGPYRFVRHPGYAGGVLSWIAAPCFFPSYPLALLALLIIAAMVARTALEDRFLRENLPGYQAYSQQVRFRLFPGIG